MVKCFSISAPLEVLENDIAVASVPQGANVLCRENSLADMITNTRALKNVEGVKFVEISLNRGVLVSTHLRHSLIREEIMKKMEKNRVA